MKSFGSLLAFVVSTSLLVQATEYKGCYLYNGIDLTVTTDFNGWDHCLIFCRNQGTTYFGIRGGYTCLCGNRILPSLASDPTLCYINCNKPQGKMCGGFGPQREHGNNFYTSVYTVE